MIYASYGGAAGILIRRFGIPKAVAIPIIPAVLLFLVLSAFYIPKGLDPLGLVGVFVFLLVLVVMGVLLVFWLHSLWARKYQMAQTRPT